jgi:hypothetical protein
LGRHQDRLNILAPSKTHKHIDFLNKINVAEEVVSEPFLPSGDQGHKGGFAPLPKQHQFAC